MDLPTEIGLLVSLIDGVAKTVGLESVTSGEIIEFSEIYGLTLNINDNVSDSATLGSDDSIFEGDIVERSESELFINAGESQIGELLDSLGNDILS